MFFEEGFDGPLDAKGVEKLNIFLSGLVLMVFFCIRELG
jgi:hypothetical protein